ncbi:MAG TPA: hypothetical protein DER02_06685 [Gammaproteobacteria bacterium]|nr:hypothetical protein [Gammaproteobacteria bacterium]|tara:strand:- start:3461 stop:4489 length:1029 start_codon:yes stop_codon:yes gene_type:complete
MRILQIDNWQWRRYGRIRVSTSRKLYHGLIRQGHKVLEFSDRDIASYEAPLKIKALGRRRANTRLIETCEQYRPDMILLGHADLISNATLQTVRELNPAMRIAYRNVDPLFSSRTVKHIERRADVVDSIFVTTGGAALKRFVRPSNRVAFMPNPTDASIEDMDNSEKDNFRWDLTFCGIGKPGDPRIDLIERLRKDCDDLTFGIFGLFGTKPVWGADYDQVLSDSKMALNLNRVEGDSLYSSARISQLMGNGILTFLSARSGLQRFFSDSQAVFFNDSDHLLQQINRFHADDAARKTVAAAGRAHYHQQFSGQNVAQFMIETTFDQPYSNDYCWQDQVFRHQ